MRRVAPAIALIILTACTSTSVAQDPVPSTTLTPTAPTTTTTTSTTTSSTTTSTTTPPTTTTVFSDEPTTLEQPVMQQFAVRAATLMDGKTRAIGVAIGRQGAVITEFALGSDASGRPLTTTSGFRLASISKVFTAVVVLQLVEEGRLRLDDTLRSVWGEPLGGLDPRVGAITIGQLLQHTSGFGPLRDTFFKNGVTDWHDAAQVAVGSVLDHDPGTFYRYSNANYVVLGVLVERLTGRPLETAVTERVLTPSGVTTGVLGTTTAITDPFGPAYVVDANRRYIEALGPAGAWIMSTGDLTRVMTALQPGRDSPLLSDASIRLMRTATTLPDDEPNWSYGLGMMVFPAWVGHTGTIEDARTFTIDLPNGYTLSVLSATGKVPSGEDLLEEFMPEIFALAALPAT
jgi:D-alanyl-D-alanine carboxypeptidase